MRLGYTLLILSIPFIARTQCPTGNVTISSQADADNYTLNYWNCDSLPGDLTISGFGINDLSGFANLDVIMGTFDWNNTYPGPFDFSGFSSLDRIGGNFTVQNCERLKGFWGLDQLDRVDGDVYIAGMDSVENASGLGQLSVVGGKLQFFSMVNFAAEGLNQLDTVYGDCLLFWSDQGSTATLPNDLDFVGGNLQFGTQHGLTINGGNDLTRVGGDLNLCCEPTMTNFYALQALDVVGGDLDLNYNDVLTNFNALQQLDTVYGDFWLNDNDVLTTVQGLNDLDHIGKLLIMDNPLLTYLSAFDQTIDIQNNVQINFNPNLSICHVQAICDHINGNEPTSAYQNAPGCNSALEIYNACNPLCYVDVTAFLEGPYDPTTGIMHDSLRARGLVPTLEPYTAMGYSHVGEGGGEYVLNSVLANTGPTAIVDWVVLELRTVASQTAPINTRAALIRRDGLIVDTDGSSAVGMGVPDGNYYVVVRHRNHLSVMSTQVVALSSGNTTTMDFTTGIIDYGTEPQKEVNGVHMLWAGNVNTDGYLKYTGASNDRDPILVAIGGSIPTNTITGYHQEDINMDGVVKYAGSDNDRDPILVNIGGSIPTNMRIEQLP